MPKRLFFFATGRDLAAIFAVAENKKVLQYAAAGRFDKVSPHLIKSFKDLPRIGVATSGSSIACDRYLISEAGLKIHSRRLHSAPFFAFDQLVNPKTVLFTAGGFWKGKILLGGSIATASNDPSSIGLMLETLPMEVSSTKSVRSPTKYCEVKAWRQSFMVDQMPPFLYDALVENHDKLKATLMDEPKAGKV
jgi:hypothetical protein